MGNDDIILDIYIENQRGTPDKNQFIKDNEICGVIAMRSQEGEDHWRNLAYRRHHDAEINILWPCLASYRLGKNNDGRRGFWQERQGATYAVGDTGH